MSDSIRPAAGILPLRQQADGPLQVYMVQRGREGRFFPGFHAFPGGAAERGEDLRVCAARELWEETGLWVGFKVPPAELRRAWAEQKLSWETLVADYPLALEQLIPSGVRTTPSYAFVRFRAQFYLWFCPADQEDDVWPGELESGRWWDVQEAVQAWEKAEVYWAAPTQDSMLALARLSGYQVAAETLQSASEDTPDPIRIRPGLAYLALETPTLPPARHTLCFVLGEDELILVDPGSSDPAELARLEAVVGDHTVVAALFTHHHPDHVGGLEWCRQRGWPLWGHAASGTLLGQSWDRELQDGEMLGDWQVVHTPGHAAGHLALWDPGARILLAADLVSGLSTILVPPEPGAMCQYLDSLRRCIALQPQLVVPSHGGPYGPDSRLLEKTLEHRLARQAKVSQALGGDLETILAKAYDDVKGPALEWARASLRSILYKLEEDGSAVRSGDRWLPA